MQLEVPKVTHTYEAQVGRAGHGMVVLVQPAQALMLLLSETGVPTEATPV
jgi:hypothetical protein